MEVLINFGEDFEFTFNSDAYDVKIMPDYEQYQNGYVDVNKCYPYNIVSQYLDAFSMWPFATGIRPKRFWFNGNKTKIIDIDTNKIFNNLDYCKAFNDFHIVKIKVQMFAYKIKHINTVGPRLQITEMTIGSNY